MEIKTMNTLCASQISENVHLYFSFFPPLTVQELRNRQATPPLLNYKEMDVNGRKIQQCCKGMAQKKPRSSSPLYKEVDDV